VVLSWLDRSSARALLFFVPPRDCHGDAPTFEVYRVLQHAQHAAGARPRVKG
jgi:hypothetical protein